MTTTHLELGDLPTGTTDADVDGPDDEQDTCREATQADYDEFCAEDLRDLFCDYVGDLESRYVAEAFGRKAADLWARYAEKHGIR